MLSSIVPSLRLSLCFRLRSPLQNASRPSEMRADGFSLWDVPYCESHPKRQRQRHGPRWRTQRSLRVLQIDEVLMAVSAPYSTIQEERCWPPARTRLPHHGRRNSSRGRGRSWLLSRCRPRLIGRSIVLQSSECLPWCSLVCLQLSLSCRSFQPEHLWMNDTIGPVYNPDTGLYHLYCQCEHLMLVLAPCTHW